MDHGCSNIQITMLILGSVLGAACLYIAQEIRNFFE